MQSSASLDGWHHFDRRAGYNRRHSHHGCGPQEMLRLRICFDEHSQFNAQLSSCLRPARCALKGAGVANLLELSGDSQQASGRRLLKLLKCG